MTSSKLSELKELRLKLTHHKWIYSEILASDEPSLEGVEVISESNQDIICSLDHDQVNDWRDSAKFIASAANNWLTLIECLQLAVESMNKVSKEFAALDADGDSKTWTEQAIEEINSKALAEIESKLGGL